jgi:hypothetical protein
LTCALARILSWTPKIFTVAKKLNMFQAELQRKMAQSSCTEQLFSKCCGVWNKIR